MGLGSPRHDIAARYSIVCQLHAEVGNRDGIGTRFTIHYGPDGERHQLREQKASGGYISFDDSRKIVNEIQLALRAGERYAKPE